MKVFRQLEDLLWKDGDRCVDRQDTPSGDPQYQPAVKMTQNCKNEMFKKYEAY